MQKNDISSYERLCNRLADLFVERFSSIEEGNCRSIVEFAFPHQNMDGVLFIGTNSLVTSMIASERGYGIPVWFTMNRGNEIGVSIKAGEHSVPIINYNTSFYEKETGKRMTDMSQADYDQLLPEEKMKYEKRSFMRFYPEFNIAQTNFSEVYPDEYSRLVEFFGYDQRTKADFSLLDDVVKANNWLCPIQVSSEVTSAVYSEGSDVIKLPQKSIFVDEHDYYNSLLHAMARATGSEMRLERSVNRKSVIESLPGVMGAQCAEALVCELAAATAGAAIGFSTDLSDSSARFLKSWISYIKAEPSIIYSLVTEASRSADMLLEGIGLKRGKGFNLTEVMDGVEKAVEARKKFQDKKSASQAASHKPRHWKGVKMSSASKKIKGSKSI